MINRRDALKSAAAIPFLSAAQLEAKEEIEEKVEDTHQGYPTIKDSWIQDGKIIIPEKELVELLEDCEPEIDLGIYDDNFYERERYTKIVYLPKSLAFYMPRPFDYLPDTYYYYGIVKFCLELNLPKKPYLDYRKYTILYFQPHANSSYYRGSPAYQTTQYFLEKKDADLLKSFRQKLD